MTDFLTYFSQTGPLHWFGVVGSIIYVATFAAMQLGRIDGNGLRFTLLNILAASLVASSLFVEFNLSTALIQFSWLLAGLAGLALRARKSRSAAHNVSDATHRTGAI